jgi:proline iminopeptidase
MQSGEGYVTTADGVRLFFRRLGSGQQQVVIPNGLYLCDDFQPLIARRTFIYYDVRNRGRSGGVSDTSRLQRGIRNDVDDLEAVRQHFGIDRLTVIGHSYMGLMVILYALAHPAHLERVVQVGPMVPKPGTQYPAHLTGADATLREVFARLAQLQRERGTEDAQEFCRKVWSVLRLLYVVDPANAFRIDWGRCELENERNFMKYWSESLLPSIQSLRLGREELEKVKTPVLTIHGRRDRSAPYGGGREWAFLLPNARLVTVEDAGHAPWIEAPERVLGSIEAFLGGAWPETAQTVDALEAF